MTRSLTGILDLGGSVSCPGLQAADFYFYSLK